MRAAPALLLVLSLLMAGCSLLGSDPDDPNDVPSLQLGEGSRYWETGPDPLAGEAPSGVETRPSHIFFHVRSYGVTVVPQGYEQHQTGGPVGVVAGDGWSALDLVEASELAPLQKKETPLSMVGAAQHPNGKGIFAAAAGEDAWVGYTDPITGLFHSVYDDMRVCDIIGVPGAVALLLLSAGAQFILYHLAEGESAMTTRVAEDVGGAGFDSGFALGPHGPIVAADGKGGLWTYPETDGRTFGEPVKSDLALSPDTLRMRCEGGFCGATDAMAGIVTFFGVTEEGSPTGAVARIDLKGATAIATSTLGDRPLFYVTGEQQIRGFVLAADGSFLQDATWPLPADCPAPRDVALTPMNSTTGDIRMFVGCGEDGAVLSHPFSPQRAFVSGSMIF